MSRRPSSGGGSEIAHAEPPPSPLHEPAPIRALNRHRLRNGVREDLPADRSTGNLFAWGAKQRQVQDAGSLSARPPPATRPSLGLERVSVRGPRDRRFRRYLASGSFGRGEPIEDDGWILRNRIIFFGLCFVLIVFSLAKIVSP